MHHSAVPVNGGCLRRSAETCRGAAWLRDRDTRLTWGCITCVAAGAKMWHLIRLRQMCR